MGPGRSHILLNMISIVRWSGTARTCERGPAVQLPATAADLAADDIIWVDLTDPTPEEESRIFSQFLPVHPLTLEDITKPRRDSGQGAHLPKAEEFPNYLFVVVNPLPPGLMQPSEIAADDTANAARARRPQLSAVLTGNVLITHHYRKLKCVDAVAEFLARHEPALGRGPDYVFHLILDSMVDEYAPVVDDISGRLDRLETRIFLDPSPQALYGMLRIKRLVSSMRKTLILEREVLYRLTRGEYALIDEREVVYYRNVYDHLVRYTELIEAAREMVSDLMETHLSAASNRLNAIMKVLTMISTIILPMTLVAGIYGMNFEDNVWPGFKAGWGFAFAIGLMAVTGIVGFVYFRWKKWA